MKKACILGVLVSLLFPLKSSLADPAVPSGVDASAFNNAVTADSFAVRQEYVPFQKFLTQLNANPPDSPAAFFEQLTKFFQSLAPTASLSSSTGAQASLKIADPIPLSMTGLFGLLQFKIDGQFSPVIMVQPDFAKTAQANAVTATINQDMYSNLVAGFQFNKYKKIEVQANADFSILDAKAIVKDFFLTKYQMGDGGGDFPKLFLEALNLK